MKGSRKGQRHAIHDSNSEQLSWILTSCCDRILSLAVVHVGQVEHVESVDAFHRARVHLEDVALVVAAVVAQVAVPRRAHKGLVLLIDPAAFVCTRVLQKTIVQDVVRLQKLVDRQCASLRSRCCIGGLEDIYSITVDGLERCTMQQ